ncbi:hypothetical protein [Providencia burhodogranariea]|uniref:hypothetical protein n=1 Tax=Providencia burhodogranariea TaxID=516074 RepID=UPI0005930B4D|nr:hypothetical protein [Providencia burhodogranariea]
MEQTLVIGNVVGRKLRDHNANLHKEVEVLWKELFVKQGEYDNLISGIPSKLDNSISTSNDTKPDTLNSLLSELPNVPDHNPSIDIVLKAEEKAKEEIAG